jgi:hypothetical protein
MFGLPQGQYLQYRHLVLVMVPCIIWPTAQAAINGSVRKSWAYYIDGKKNTLANPACNGVNTGRSQQSLWIAIRSGLTGTIGYRRI